MSSISPTISAANHAVQSLQEKARCSKEQAKITLKQMRSFYHFHQSQLHSYQSKRIDLFQKLQERKVTHKLDSPEIKIYDDFIAATKKICEKEKEFIRAQKEILRKIDCCLEIDLPRRKVE